MINENDLKIYCIYHNDKLINEYKLNCLPKYIELFNVNDLSMPGDNINYLNKSLCELVVYYYIWKNNIYSPYVGFCHYHRFYDNLGFDNLKKYGVHYFGWTSCDINYYDYTIQHIFQSFNYNNFNKFKKYLYDSKKFNRKLLNDFTYNNLKLKSPWKYLCIFKWEHFNNICKICFDLLEYLYPHYKDFYKKRTYYHLHRRIAWEFEIYFAIIVALYFNNVEIFDTNWNKKEKP